MEKKDYIGLFETKEVKDKNQEDKKKFPFKKWNYRNLTMMKIPKRLNPK